MNKIHKIALILTFLFCVCNLCAYGQEEALIQKFADFAKKVDALNQANLCVLEQANRHSRGVMESELKELRDHAQSLTNEATALQSEFEKNGIQIHQLQKGLKILSDARFQALSKAARFRKIWKEMCARKIHMGTEEDIPRKWSFFDMRIGDSEKLHADTKKRIRECIIHIKAYSDDIGLLLANTTSETDENEAASRLGKLINALEMEYLIACEYVTDDPVGAEDIRKELDKTVSLDENSQLKVKY